MEIGVRNVCFRTATIEEGLDHAAALGIASIQLAPQRLDLESWNAERARCLRQACASRGLRISGLSAGPNLVDPARSDDSVATFERILQAGCDLETEIVTGEVKAVPAEVAPAEAWATLLANVRKVAAVAGRLGMVYAIEIGPTCLLNSPDRLEMLLHEAGSDRLAVNLDPANINSGGNDPVEATLRLGTRIVHTHAKDSHREDDGSFVETPLGEGDVDFPAWLGALSEVGYDGVLCIEREAGPDPVGDVRRAVERLRKWLA